MRCPGCKYPLIVLEIERVEIDHCLACGGVWLDAGELELLLAGASNAEALICGLQVDTTCAEKARVCPICDARMEKISGAGGETTRLDRCVNGHGLWLDRGELMEIITLGHFTPDDRVYRLLHEVFGRGIQPDGSRGG